MANLTALDRCDRCGAQALVRVGIGSFTLTFCGHHYRANAEALEAKGATVLESDLTEDKAFVNA